MEMEVIALQNTPIPTTIRIDPIKKELFEKLSHLHHKTISDICREGIDRELEQYLPAYSLREKAAVLRAELLAIEEALPLSEKVDLENLSSRTISATPIVDSIFLDYRESLLNPESKGSIIGMMNRGVDPAWERFYFKAGFETASEAKKWCWAEAMKRGLVQ